MQNALPVDLQKSVAGPGAAAERQLPLLLAPLQPVLFD